MKRVVLDATSVMTLLEDRSGVEKVERLLEEAVDRKVELLMSVVNWGEVYYTIWRGRGETAAAKLAQQIAQLPIEIVDADLSLTKLAAEFRAKFKLPYADCFAAALAQQNKATLATGDNDFRLVAKHVNILWTG